MSKISVVMIVKNEAAIVARALQSARWADEIVVIDAFSTDGTAVLCQEHGARVFQYAWEDFSKQRERSLAHASHEWIFSLDADEEISAELQREIQEVVLTPVTLPGYWVPRKTRYLERWIEHSGWYPDWQLRLFRKAQVFIEPRAVHEGFSVRGETGKLSAVLFHYSYASIAAHIEKINRYTTLEVSSKLARLHGRPVRWYHLIFNPWSRFLRMFLVKRGYKDGFPGFLLALFAAFYILLLYAKIWEQEHSDARKQRGVG